MENNQLICSLIEDELVNSSLINGLNRLGLDANNYRLHLSETIFQLMGFENSHQTDEAYSRFLKLIREAGGLVPNYDDHSLMQQTHEIYQQLLTIKNAITYE
jgi:hypothetical protein